MRQPSFLRFLANSQKGGLISPLPFWIAVVLNHLLSLRTAHDKERARAPTQPRWCLAGGGHVTQPAQNSVASIPGPRSASALMLGSQSVVLFVTTVWRRDCPSVGGWVGLGRGSVPITVLRSCPLSLFCPVGEVLSQWQPCGLSGSWEGRDKEISSRKAEVAERGSISGFCTCEPSSAQLTALSSEDLSPPELAFYLCDVPNAELPVTTQQPNISLCPQRSQLQSPQILLV